MLLRQPCKKIIKTYPKTDVAKEAAQRIREFDQKK